MPFFRRREPLHERLARQGGLQLRHDLEELDPRPPLLETGIHGVQRPRTWDATVTASIEGIDADEAVFVSLPDGTLLVEEGPDTSLDLLADAVERELRPPYRARAVRRSESLWAVQARRIEVIELPGAPPGDVLDLSRTADGASELRVDGERVFGTVPALEGRGAREGAEFAVHAERLEGDVWEVRSAAL
jgi:hypothetical protein